MTPSEHLDERMLHWEEARHRGISLSAETLCADCPELVVELRQRIQAVEEMEGVLGVRPRDPRKTLREETLLAACPGSEGPLPQVPGYQLVRVLGQGGMGIVYEAVQTELGRTVALKMISGSRLGPKLVARFRTEAEAAARLQHPNVLQIFEIGQVQDRPFYSMEYVPGGNLDQYLADASFTPREAARLIETLARAVHAAHERGIVHRDLKPANVLIAADGTPKIADFGLAKRLDEDSGHTMTGEILGTPAYMSPEQAAGVKDVGPATDIYSLGAILYELLTHRPPFQGASPLDALRQVTGEDPVPPSKLVTGLPRDLEAICLKCLEKSPGRRYGSALELADDLGRYLDGRPVVARRISMARRVWKWIRRHPLESALALVLLVLACLPGVAWVREYQQQREIRLRAEVQAPLARDILRRHCAECHDRDGTERKDFDVLDHARLLSRDRPLVIAGAPDDSRLIQRIADGTMPPEEEEVRLPRLSEQELTILREWIQGGAPPFPEGGEPPPPVVPYSALAARTRDIFLNRCYECHNYDVKEGGIKILHHRLLVTVRKVVVPGRPDESELFQLLIGPDDAHRMPPPPAERLPEAEIATIRDWILAGAPPFPKEE